MTRGVDFKQAIGDCDLVERGSFFVAEEGIGDPELVPASVVQSNLDDLAVDWYEGQTRITPPLPEVHAQRVILGRTKYRPTYYSSSSSSVYPFSFSFSSFPSPSFSSSSSAFSSSSSSSDVH